MNTLGNFFGNALGGSMLPGWQQQTSGSNTFPGQVIFPPQPLKKVLHAPRTADGFQNLTGYLRALISCEEHCECKWCAASELERKMAIVLVLKPEAPDNE